jgi:hypothetical protein
MSLREYITLFGSVFSKKTRKTTRFQLWPKQARLCDLLDISKESCIPKARQLGISELTAEESVKLALQSDKMLILIFSKTERDAIEYLETKIRPKIAALPRIKGITWPTIDHESMRHIKLSNGSRIVCLPASNRAGASHVADHVVFDEAGGIDLQPGVSLSVMYRNVSPTLEKADGKMRLVGTSEPGSYFNQMIREIVNGEKPIDCFFLPATADPSRTQEWFRRTRTKFPSDADFLSQYPETLDDFFVVREGLIYPQFDPKEGGLHVREFEAPPRANYYISYDHGYRHPAVLLELYHDTLSDVIYVRRETVWKETHAEHIADDIKGIINERNARPYKMIADSAIFAETGVKGVIEVWKERGLEGFKKSIKHRAKSGLDASAADISHRLTDGRIVIHPDCHNLIQELQQWHWDANLKGEKPIDSFNDSIDCLVAGTKITLYDNTTKPIEAVQAGDYVKTLDGPKKVLISGSTGVKQIWVVETAHGTLNTTKGHKVMTTKGYVAVEELTSSMYLILSEANKCDRSAQSTKALSTIDTQTRKTTETDTLFRVTNICTGLFGQSILGKFLKATKSTIRTATSLITPLRTWSALAPRSIAESTGQKSRASGAGIICTPMQDQKRPSGTEAKRDCFGTRNTPKTSPLDALLTTLLRALSALTPSRPRPNTQSFAPTSASLNFAEIVALMTRFVNASDAGKISSLINIGRLRVAAVPVLSVYATERREETFNLTVQDSPEFFANGLLVHNCLRYALAELDPKMVVNDTPIVQTGYRRKAPTLGKRNNKKIGNGAWMAV